jgi:4-hydroxy-tetrahydrodipicolinate synthase
MTASIRGIISPVLTPIDDGAVAIDRVPDSVEFARRCGCHALVAAGTGVQETVALTVAERKELVTATIDAADGDVPVLAGVSHPAQHVVDELIAHAENAGVDAVLAMPPWGLDPDRETVIAYYEAIADATDLPLLLYNNPTVTVNLARETMRDIARLDGVAYVKETSRNWKKLAWLVEHVDEAGHADVFGTMDVLLPTLQAGGAGAVIPVPANAPAMRIYEAYEAGDLEAAAEAQRTFAHFPPEEAATGLTPVAKAAAELSGVPVGPPRPPYHPVSDDTRDAIDAWLDRENVPSLD